MTTNIESSYECNLDINGSLFLDWGTIGHVFPGSIGDGSDSEFEYAPNEDVETVWNSKAPLQLLLMIA